MNSEDIVKVCKDYGVTTEELQVASAVELLADRGDNGSERISLEGVVQNMRSVLGVKGILKAITWARWVKHARQNDKPGKNVAELLEMRK